MGGLDGWMVIGLQRAPLVLLRNSDEGLHKKLSPARVVSRPRHSPLLVKVGTVVDHSHVRGVALLLVPFSLGVHIAERPKI